jgi:hypothetical protein
MGELRNAYKILVGKSEEKRQLGRPKRSRENNIRTDLTEIGWKDGHIWLRIRTNDRLM